MPPQGRRNVINLVVGNAVPGVPSGAMRKHRARKNASPEVGGTGAENLPIEVKFSEGTPGTAFPTVALVDDIAMNGVGSFSIFL